MIFDLFARKKAKPEEKTGGKKGKALNVVIISAACCVPGMDAFDRQARSVIDQAISETGIRAKVTLVPAPVALATFRKIVDELISMYNKGKIGVPAILIGTEAVSYGVPRLEDMKMALKRFAKNEINKLNND